LKWAQSQDGYMDAARQLGEEPVKFSSSFTQTLVHRMRAMHQAIMVGTNTVLMDNPSLTTRLWDGPNPLRVTIDRKGLLPEYVYLKDKTAPTVIFDNGDLRQILDDLYKRGIQSLMVEGGAQLLQHFIDANLWDEARIEIAPINLGEGVSAPKIRNALLVDKTSLDERKILNYKHEM
jgi:diaminohydroxyphosphoribosylaminopyrimidine deaminase/5-amino-6-(5-phosphoribosylamino)uracil reductase